MSAGVTIFRHVPSSFTPDSVALKSFMNWIRVRTCVTALRKTLETNEVFHVLKDTPSFSREQQAILKALQRIYESGKHKIYSAFASEDPCISLFHENIRYVQCHDDAHGFWFLLLAFAAGTNREMMLICRDVMVLPGKFEVNWIFGGRKIFETSGARVFTSCTRRGNLHWCRIKEGFLSGVDVLCKLSSASLRNKYISAVSRQTFLDDALDRMIKQIGLKSFGQFKIYFVAKVVKCLDDRFCYHFLAGPSVSVKGQTSALHFLFPNINTDGLSCATVVQLDKQLLQTCLRCSVSHLPQDITCRLKIDDLEHSACEWVRTLKYGDLLPFEETVPTVEGVIDLTSEF